MRYRQDSMIIYLLLLCVILIDIIKKQWIGGFLGICTGILLIYWIEAPDNKHIIDKLLWR